MIFLYLNLLDLYNISFVYKHFNFLVRNVKRYKRHFQLWNKIISIIQEYAITENTLNIF